MFGLKLGKLSHILSAKGLFFKLYKLMSLFCFENNSKLKLEKSCLTLSCILKAKRKKVILPIPLL